MFISIVSGVKGINGSRGSVWVMGGDGKVELYFNFCIVMLVLCFCFGVKHFGLDSI